MSIDEVMRLATRYAVLSRTASMLDAREMGAALREAIEQHVAEAVAREREECADAARQWEDDYVIEDSAPRHVDAAIRARGTT